MIFRQTLFLTHLSLLSASLAARTELIALPLPWDALCTRRNLLATKMSNLQLQIWHNWQQSIERQIAQGLAEPVLLQAPEADRQQLLPNFAQSLFTLLKETKYLLALQAAGSLSSKLFQMPEVLLKLYVDKDAYWQRRIRLVKIDEFYNGIRSGQCGEAELQLIASELAQIDEQVARACAQLTWCSYGECSGRVTAAGLTNYFARLDATLVASIYDKSRALYARLQQSHDNLELILSSMQRWSREPLHQRSLYGRNLLDLRHQQERVRLRLQQCDETRCLLNRLLIANFCLFFDYETQQFQLYSRDLSVQEVSGSSGHLLLLLFYFIYSFLFVVYSTVCARISG